MHAVLHLIALQMHYMAQFMAMAACMLLGQSNAVKHESAQGQGHAWRCC